MKMVIEQFLTGERTLALKPQPCPQTMAAVEICRSDRLPRSHPRMPSEAVKNRVYGFPGWI